MPCASCITPESAFDIEPQTPARRRLAYDELLAGQLSLALVRQTLRKLPGHPVVAEGKLRQAILDALPFSLTGSQTTAVEEVLTDMAKLGPDAAFAAGRCRFRQDRGRNARHGRCRGKPADRPC